MRGRMIRTPGQIIKDNQLQQQRRQEQILRVNSQPTMNQHRPPPLERSVSQIMHKIQEEGEAYFAKKRQIRNMEQYQPNIRVYTTVEEVEKQKIQQPQQQPPQKQLSQPQQYQQPQRQQQPPQQPPQKQPPQKQLSQRQPPHQQPQRQQPKPQRQSQFHRKESVKNVLKSVTSDEDDIDFMESLDVYSKANRVQADDFVKIPNETHITWITKDSVLFKQGKIMYLGERKKAEGDYWMIDLGRNRKIRLCWNDIDVLYLDEPLETVISKAPAIIEGKVNNDLTKMQKALKTFSQKIKKMKNN